MLTLVWCRLEPGCYFSADDRFVATRKGSKKWKLHDAKTLDDYICSSYSECQGKALRIINGEPEPLDSILKRMEKEENEECKKIMKRIDELDSQLADTGAISDIIALKVKRGRLSIIQDILTYLEESNEKK